ncbi:uncharacterized mitochondrial protein AtMg00240-like [Rutidosis leptorrhynchoides]|uniref:uncharacterized mitochondrial protein AtMg00240-like n=1 Tax=Rutidosis leptorrhynchoides TaxID=125765 RepID=UPI003A9A1CFA
MLKDVSIINQKTYKTPLDLNCKLTPEAGAPLPDPEVCRRLNGKLIYLKITRPYICYSVLLLSQFMQQPTFVHLQVVEHLLRYLPLAPAQGTLLDCDSAIQLKTFCDSDWESFPITHNQLLDIVFCCVILQFHGNKKGKVLFLVHQQKPNTGQWH